MGDKKLMIMAGVLLLAICVFVGYYLMAKKNPDTDANGGTTGTTTATAPPPGGAAPTGAPPTGAPAGGAPMTGTPPPAPMGTPPGAIPIAAAAPVSTLPAIALPAVPQIQPPKPANWKDIFAGGPPPPKKNKGKKVEQPAQIAVYDVPAIAFTPDKQRSGPRTSSERRVDAPIGRHAGWIYSTNGQVVAIFEDSEGNARAIRVGDEIEGHRVKAIAQDSLILVDSTGRELRLKLQGMDTYQGKTTRNVAIDATPGTPAPPAWGTAP